ncbi:serine/threonine-protein kinase Chk1-like [Oratosquilla oratoria]|uniref:serine/threonine-protein kinase Chk1-like n=1 Tax=Oratosquilla oratoria TaxID=337810 RepID=UPI003F75A462
MLARIFYCCFPREFPEDKTPCQADKETRKKRRFFWRLRRKEKVVTENLVRRRVSQTLEQKNREAARNFENKDNLTELSVLGRGSFSWVTLIRNAKTSDVVTQKCVHRLVESSNAKEEIILFQLNHANVVKLLCWKRSLTVLTMYTEFCSRGTLVGVLKNLSYTETRGYFSQLMDGVEHLHLRGVVHRDIKPQNLLLTGDKTLKIADFGCACVFVRDGREIRLRGLVGSEPYVAPEVFKRATYLAPAVDLWSCGVVLFNMLTGSSPWKRAALRVKEYRMWVDEDAALYRRKEWRRIDSRSRRLLKSLLEPNPKRRMSAWKYCLPH